MSFRFGIASEIPVEKSTIAFCGTVLFLVTFETITHKFEELIGNSPTYNKMLQRIYKELMINGFVSFALSIYMALYPKEAHSEWIHVMEFCGYVLFFVAIFFVAHGLYIIGLSLFSAQQYDIYHSTPISEIIQQITKVHQTWQEYLFDLRYLPFSSLRSVAEFKIINALFRDTYWLPSHFDYGSYLSGCFERYSLRIVKIGKVSWGVMFLLGVLNYIRVKFMGEDAFNCKGFKTASDVSHGGGGGGGGGGSHSLDFEPLGGDAHNDTSTEEDKLHLGGRYGITHACSDIHLQLFFACGCVVTLYVVAVYLFGRSYVIRLISHSGVTEIRDYGEFLALEESASLKSEDIRTFEINVEDSDSSRSRGPSNRSRRMSINTLRTNLDRAASHNESEKSAHHSNDSFLFNLWDSFSAYWSARVRPIPFIPLQFSPRNSIQSIQQPSPSPYPPASAPVPTPQSIPAPAPPLSRTGSLRGQERRRSSVVMTLDRSGGHSATGLEGLTSIEQFKLTKKTRDSQRNSGTNLVTDAFRRVTSLVGEKITDAPHDDGPGMKLSEDFSHIYLFRSPDMYYWAVECCIVLNSLYLSMWITNYITVVQDETNSTILWQILMMCPLFIIMPLVGEIVKTASMLSAIAELEIDIMGTVLEEMEDQKLLLENLRTNAKSRIATTGPALREILENLFNTIDYTHKGYLNKGDIREFFRALHLHYSNDKFNRLFFVIDHNKDGEISFNELYRLLCPNEVEEEDRKIRTEAISKMNEVVRVRPKGSFSRLKTLILPTNNLVQPVEGDSGSSQSDSRKNSSWKWFTSEDGSRSKSEKDLSPTSDQRSTAATSGAAGSGGGGVELSGQGDQRVSPVVPVYEEKERDIEKEDDENDSNEILSMEELRDQPETTTPERMTPPRSQHSTTTTTTRRQHFPHHSYGDDEDVRILELDQDELV